MSFPKPVQLPKEVQEARKARSSAIVRIAFWGIAIRFGYCIFELAGFFVYKSSALLVDALSTFADVASSLCSSYQLNLQKDRLIVNIPLVMDDMSNRRIHSLESFSLGVWDCLYKQSLGLITAHIFNSLLGISYSSDCSCDVRAHIQMMRRTAKKGKKPSAGS